jgi:hypothetical protein
MENSIPLRSTNHQILHEKPETMFNSLTESLKTVSEPRDVETDTRSQSQETTPLMSIRSSQQTREATMKATPLLRRKRHKMSLNDRKRLRKNLLHKMIFRNRRLRNPIKRRDVVNPRIHNGH